MIDFAQIILLLVALVGVAGTFLPALPGTPLIAGAALIYAWWSGFTVLNWLDIVVLAVLAAVSYLGDFLFGITGARRFGAGRPGMVGAMIGLLLGIPVFGPIGLLVGPIVGAATGELIYGRQWQAALKAGVGAGVGTLIATLSHLVIAIIMFAYLCWQLFTA